MLTGSEPKKLVEMYEPGFLAELLRRMTLIREFELRAIEERRGGLIPGFIHSCVGQEATAVGVCLALTSEDVITSTHRGHGHLIAKGGDPKYMMAELAARSPGYCKGRGGSLHIADFSLGILGANGIVGGGIPMATGAALGFQMETMSWQFMKRSKLPLFEQIMEKDPHLLKLKPTDIVVIMKVTHRYTEHRKKSKAG